MNANIQPAVAQNIKMPETIRNATETIGNSINAVTQNVNQSLSEFSKQASAGAGASSQFLQSNTVVAKFAFLILVLIAFLFLFSLGISLIGYFTTPSEDPFLVKGLRAGSFPNTISTDPKVSDSIVINRSNNMSTGIEFTWSVWVYIEDLNNKTNTYQHVFSKGNGIFDDESSISTINNAPGMYIKPGAIKYKSGTLEHLSGDEADETPTQCVFHIIMNTSAKDDSTNLIEIDNIPLKKWVHVAIRLENTMLDVYINGTISGRLNLQQVPKQNYDDVQISQNGGFNGSLSDLRYFSNALSVIDINKLVYWGPNTNQETPTSSTTGGYSYLSSLWYSSRL